MPRKTWTDALYKRDLRAAWEECPTPQVKKLLWEIDRLQQLLVEAERVLSELRDQSWTTTQLVTPLWVVLDQEPAVRWRRQADARLKAAQRFVEGNPLDHYRYRSGAVDDHVPSDKGS